MKRRVVSIFSGIDSLGLGFREYFDVVLAVELEAKACETLRVNKDNFHPNLVIWNRDISTISKEEIAQFKGVEGIIGGPPCQPFSRAKGVFDRDNKDIRLIYTYLDWVSVIKPQFFLFENVKGLTDKDKVYILEDFLQKATELGYSVHYKVVNCHDYGSAQKRERLFVVGFRDDIKVDFKFPEPVANKKYVRDILDTDVVGDYVEAREKIRMLMPFISEGGHWRDLKKEEHLIMALGVNYARRSGGMTGMYRRLHRDKPCPTLVTSPVQNTTLLYHPLEDRPLSVTEYQRGQGIPDDYTIIGSPDQKYKFIGNGVPVEAANELAKAISNTLDNAQY